MVLRPTQKLHARQTSHPARLGNPGVRDNQIVRTTKYMNRHRPPVTLLQASRSNPGLARLMDAQRESSARLQAILTLIPASLRNQVQAGPIEDEVWCLLLSNTTTVAKMRQMLPAFEAHLRVHGLSVKSIRLKVRRQD